VRNFTIDKVSGIFEGLSLDAYLSRNNIPSLANALGIAKNLDEYQLKICLNLPSFSDTDPIKSNLQKFRIAIIASFAFLVVTLRSTDPNNGLESWNFFASKLLRETSGFFSKLGTYNRLKNCVDDAYLEETFRFFKVPLKDIREAMTDVYSL
jgi:hypothetical protein